MRTLGLKSSVGKIAKYLSKILENLTKELFADLRTDWSTFSTVSLFITLFLEMSNDLNFSNNCTLSLSILGFYCWSSYPYLIIWNEIKLVEMLGKNCFLFMGKIRGKLATKHVERYRVSNEMFFLFRILVIFLKNEKSMFCLVPYEMKNKLNSTETCILHAYFLVTSYYYQISN